MVGHFGLKLRMALAGSILFAFYAAIAVVAFAVWGQGVLPLVLLVSLLFVGFQYKFGKWAALKSVGAEDMPEEGEYRRIHQKVEELSREMDIEKPRLMVAEMGVPNAFAVGRKGNGTVVVSEEIVSLLDREELDGVLAHELAHIRNRDVVVMVIGQSIASMIGILVQFAVIFGGERNIGAYIFGMIAGQIAQMIVMIFVMAISRYREYVADEDAADVTGNPAAMARALEKISNGAERAREENQAAAQAGLQGGRRRGRSQREQGVGLDRDKTVGALCINNSSRGLLQTVFATHPPIEKRIERLRSA
ncbi:MAG: M48 family metallopeptidase [Salinirussus sp.]